MISVGSLIRSCFTSFIQLVNILTLQGQNVGDSRAVLAMRDEDNSLIVVQLTVDLKPDLPREAATIQQYKRRVFSLQDEPEAARVWLPNNYSPGLMPRAFGDFCLKDFGLISVPDIYHHCLTEIDEFIILATDGLSLFSSIILVTFKVVASAPSHAAAARTLVDCAVPVRHGGLTEKFSEKSQGQLKRSLAECIPVAEDEERSALEGVTRVNSLLSISQVHIQ
ncbi:hypothetical protein Patl1_33253 [Pistacia atlantica]|uniref:Uncharacterized protein n=1 Tax=Pistacia atlantica TaxID=434234 RepID=A0ACC1APY1_9ROSI|nr:hypothetical protein Patl1_33253 [Pistacia atlantica]